MTEQETFQKQFGALAVTTRAALVFRYRENLPLSHVAQLVDRPAAKLEQHLDRVLTELLKSGALVPTGTESSEEVLRRRSRCLVAGRGAASLKRRTRTTHRTTAPRRRAAASPPGSDRPFSDLSDQRSGPQPLYPPKSYSSSGTAWPEPLPKLYDE